MITCHFLQVKYSVENLVAVAVAVDHSSILQAVPLASSMYFPVVFRFVVGIVICFVLLNSTYIV